MRRLLLQIIAGILGILLAVKFVPGVEFIGPIFVIPGPGVELSQVLGTLVFVGAFLGFLNFFVKPILNAITLPLRIITLGLFSIVISMAMIWVLDLMFAEVYIPWLYPLLWTTLIIWTLGLFIEKLLIKDR